nr:Uncharacterised protein [Streptococcus thermophilus]
MRTLNRHAATALATALAAITLTGCTFSVTLPGDDGKQPLSNIVSTSPTTTPPTETSPTAASTPATTSTTASGGEPYYGGTYKATLPNSRGLNDCSEPIHKVDLTITFSANGEEAEISSKTLGNTAKLKQVEPGSYEVTGGMWPCERPDRGAAGTPTRYRNPADPNDNTRNYSTGAVQSQTIFNFRQLDGDRIEVHVMDEEKSFQQFVTGERSGA